MCNQAQANSIVYIVNFRVMTLLLSKLGNRAQKIKGHDEVLKLKTSLEAFFRF